MNFRNQYSKARPKKNTLVVGKEKVIEAMRTGKALDRIYVSTTVHGEQIDEIKELATAQQIPINKVPVQKLDSFNVSNHGNCIAVISKIKYQDLHSAIQNW